MLEKTAEKKRVVRAKENSKERKIMSLIREIITVFKSKKNKKIFINCETFIRGVDFKLGINLKIIVIDLIIIN